MIWIGQDQRQMEDQQQAIVPWEVEIQYLGK